MISWGFEFICNYLITLTFDCSFSYSFSSFQDSEPPARKLKKKPALEDDDEDDEVPVHLQEYVPTPISELEREKQRREERRREKEVG